MWISEQTVIISLHSIKYADGLVLLAKEETVLEGMTSRQTELGRCSGMEVNVVKTKIMRVSKEPSPLQIMIDHNQLENVEYFSYLGKVT